MRTIAYVLAVGMWLTPVLSAQNPQMMQRREQLQHQVMQRFMENFRTQAGLTDEQFQRFQELTGRFLEQRTQLQAQERRMWMALGGQMRPGIAADADSVAALIEGLIGVQEQQVQLAREEQEQFSAFLTPVQRGQLMIAWRRLQMQIEGVRGRMMGPPDGSRGPPGF